LICESIADQKKKSIAEINSAREKIREDINISANESIGYFELKKHK
jgi:hypothetical protein